MDSNFFWRRLHSLTGVIPVGLFLVYHLYMQLFLHSDNYNAKVNEFYDSPLAFILLVIVVYIPLFFHSLLGVKLAFDAKVQPEYQYFPHVLYWLQRLSGIGVLLFIFGHLYNAKWVAWMDPNLSAGERPDHYQHLVDGFADPDYALVTKTVYALGILGATFHLSNGLNTFCMTWGIVITPQGQARVRVFSIVLFIILTAMSVFALSAIW